MTLAKYELIDAEKAHQSIARMCPGAFEPDQLDDLSRLPLVGAGQLGHRALQVREMKGFEGPEGRGSVFPGRVERRPQTLWRQKERRAKPSR
ncbi:hypothetical protein DP939_39490 [Spongiactinospora rosea]|uniref:Uncharacterized protein n=1 Tax=Spongiactinospora rosea TaxID=2248750 RepID=A0A366LLZ2_9ACTN|nr:hypothetical protein DP939_39490 [Spongiactinospora rosea]